MQTARKDSEPSYYNYDKVISFGVRARPAGLDLIACDALAANPSDAMADVVGGFGSHLRIRTLRTQFLTQRNSRFARLRTSSQRIGKMLSMSCTRFSNNTA